MPNYTVSWSIDVFEEDLEVDDPAEAPRAAAREALDAITRPSSIAHVFIVTDGTRCWQVDLDYGDVREIPPVPAAVA